MYEAPPIHEIRVTCRSLLYINLCHANCFGIYSSTHSLDETVSVAGKLKPMCIQQQ